MPVLNYQIVDIEIVLKNNNNDLQPSSENEPKNPLDSGKY